MPILQVQLTGANVLVANFRGNTVTKLRSSDATNLGTFAVENSLRAVPLMGPT
jgi:hypothetical protein